MSNCTSIMVVANGISPLGTIFRNFILAFCLANWINPLLSRAATIGLTSLKVENKVAPIGIDVAPRFSWIVTSDQRGTVQQSYRLQISETSTGTAGTWDSGVVTSSQPYGALYGGPVLKPDTTYFWTVTIATSAGSSTAASNFTTGFFSQADWGSSLWIGKGNGTAGGALSLSNSNWIWSSEPSPPNAPPGSIAFRKTFNPPSGKTAKAVDIVMTADDQFTLWVNGVNIGASPTTADIWKTAQTFSIAALNTSSILFAVSATNVADVGTGGDGPAGLIAVIKVTYTDDTSDMIVTDSTWRVTSTVPNGFQAIAFNDASWSNAALLGLYGVSPWGTSVAVTQPAAASLSLTGSNWVWTNEPNPPNAPATSNAFRKTFAVPNGKTAKSVDIVMTCDNLFTLWVNGALVGSSPPDQQDVWEVAQTFSVNVNGGASVVFAINGTNLADVNTGGDSPAGLLGIFRINYADGTSQAFVTDATWRSSNSLPSGFQSASFDDSTWNNTVIFSAYGGGPWGTQVSIPQPLVEHPAPLLRKSFTVDKPLSYARLYWAAGGFASISLNGVQATDHVMTPGFTNWDLQTQYVGADIKSKLTVGATNVIGIELGRSHYSVTQGNVWNWDQAPWRAEPSVRAIVSLGYTDGTKAAIVTDGSWLMIDGPTRLDDIFGGENYDAGFTIPNWNTASLSSTSSWTAAKVVAGPKGVLLNQRQQPIRIVESMSPTSITKLSDGIFVVAFPRVVAGWVQLRASGPAKSLITIHFGEKLNPDGSVIYQDLQHYYANNWQTDRFWLAGTGGVETFEPKFSYKGFGYVQIEGWPSSTPPTTADITARVVHTDLQPQGGFASSSDILNKLQVASVRAMLNNVHSIITDCPQFEKNGWSGDAMLSAEGFFATLDSQELYAKYVRDLEESRINNQGPPGEIAPSGGWGEGGRADPWHAAFVLIPYWLYQYRGDVRVLQDHYSNMKDYVEFELNRSPNGIASTDLGDWNSPETSPLGGNPPEDTRVAATAYLYQMLVTMSQVATVLSQTADASTFQSQAASVKNAFNSAFLSNSTGYYVGVGDSGFRQTHNLLAIAFGMTPNNSTITTAATAVAKDVQNRSVHLNTGALGTKYILPVLSENGHADIAIQVAQQTTAPSWGFWIANGATTVWEHWSIDSRSRDHHFLGTFQDWMFKDLAGIRLTAPAFQQVSVAPLHTSQLASASAWTMTPYGNFSVSWSNSGGTLTLMVGVPVGVQATVSIPASSVGAVSESGRSLSNNGDVQVQGATGGAVKVTIGSGQYSFSSKA